MKNYYILKYEVKMLKCYIIIKIGKICKKTFQNYAKTIEIKAKMGYNKV